jgi:hypothetical protein
LMMSSLPWSVFRTICANVTKTALTSDIKWSSATWKLRLA